MTTGLRVRAHMPRLRDQHTWGVKAAGDLLDLIYYDASMLFSAEDKFAAKVAELAIGRCARAGLS